MTKKIKRRKEIRKEHMVQVRLEEATVKRVDNAIKKTRVKSRSHILRVGAEMYLEELGL
jgi:metal-responsive CopG/Arc/MetJ family transcriptional regulator